MVRTERERVDGGLRAPSWRVRRIKVISTLEKDGARWTGTTDVTEMPSNKLYVPLLYDDDSSFTPHMLSSTV